MRHPFADTLRVVCLLRNTTPEELAQRSGRISPEMMQNILHWTYPSFSPDVIDWLADDLDLQGYQRRAFFEAAHVPLSEQGNRLLYRVFAQLCQERNMTMVQVSQQAGLSPTEVQAMLDFEFYPTYTHVEKVEQLADALNLQGQDRLMFFRSGGFEPFNISEEDESEEVFEDEDEEYGETAWGHNQSPRHGEPLRIFYCYAQQDKKLRDTLDKHLMLLKHIGMVTTWHDCEIQAGTDWQHEIATHLLTSHLILLLVSPDFMASDYCYSTEMRQAIALHNRGYALVIPILLRPVDFRGAPFAHLSPLPINKQAITSAAWRNRDEAFYQVALNVRTIVEEWQEKQREKQDDQTERGLDIPFPSA